MFKKEKPDFNFFVSVDGEDLEKASKKDRKTGRYDNMKIKGVASDSSEDTDSEILEPKGFELSRFLQLGTINYDHKLRESPKFLIGEPVSAKVINDKFHVEAKLYKESEVARDVWDTMIMLKAAKSTRKMGFSIEGKAITRDVRNPKIVKRALITGLAVTMSPKNANSYADIVKGGYSNPLPNYEYEIEDDNVEKSIQSTNGGIVYLVDVTDKDKGIRYTIDKDLNLKVEKAMDTTTTKPLIKESLEGDKKKKRAILNLANAAMLGNISKSLFNKAKSLFVVNKAIESGMLSEDINILIKAKKNLQAKNPSSRWVTINGAKVLIGEGGNVIAGAGGKLGGGDTKNTKGDKKSLSSAIKEASKIGGNKPVNERSNKEIGQARELIENTMPKSKGEMTWNEYKSYGVAIQKQSSHSQPDNFYERGAKMEHEWALKNKEKSKDQFNAGKKEGEKSKVESKKKEVLKGKTKTFKEYSILNKPQIGDKIKVRENKGGGLTSGTDGEIYEVTANGKSFKLMDDYGNKSPRLNHMSDFQSKGKKKVTISRVSEVSGGKKPIKYSEKVETEYNNKYNKELESVSGGKKITTGDRIKAAKVYNGVSFINETGTKYSIEVDKNAKKDTDILKVKAEMNGKTAEKRISPTNVPFMLG